MKILQNTYQLEILQGIDAEARETAYILCSFEEQLDALKVLYALYPATVIVHVHRVSMATEAIFRSYSRTDVEQWQREEEMQKRDKA